ncbi:MAG: sigma-70 family RNA polymerase sigma factor [Planctomycetota bacterium]
MSELGPILRAIEAGDVAATDELLPLVYKDLRREAARQLSGERAGHTLQPTALVHEAYVRLTNNENPQQWNSDGHFFRAAAEAMRRILVENARRKQTLKRGGGYKRLDLALDDINGPKADDELIALDEALDRLTEQDERAAQLIKLRFFAGLTMEQAAEALGISVRTAERDWAYARAWLHKEVCEDLSQDV